MDQNKLFSRRSFLGLSAAAAASVALAGCSSGAQSSASAAASGAASSAASATSEAAASAEQTAAAIEIGWARDNSGNTFQEIALEKGWFEEAGISIVQPPIDASNEAMAALVGDQLQIISNYGTNLPLQNIAAGDDLQIVGGYMATGCMPLIAKTGTKWNGVEDLLGKKVASDAAEYTITGPLLEMGHDPINEVEWVNYPNYSDMTAAIIKGEIDYAVVGTSRNYEVSQQPDLEVMCYKSDLMPWYSCCRMVVRTDWLEQNRDTLRTIIAILLRGQSYYERNKDEAKQIMAKRMNVTEDYLSSYMDNEHFRISVDPLKHEVMRAWDILDKTGFLSENAKDVKIEDHINVDIYKEALDEAQEKWGDEDPEFYEKMQEFFIEHNA